MQNYSCTLSELKKYLFKFVVVPQNWYFLIGTFWYFHHWISSDGRLIKKISTLTKILRNSIVAPMIIDSEGRNILK
jgi:hypothetical protein